MQNKDGLSPEAFEELLDWLDPDREEAGRKYETIRHGLIQIFEHHRCSDPESLTDITIDRVCSKIKQVAEEYSVDHAAVFHGFAYFVRLEHYKAPRESTFEEDLPVELPEMKGDKYHCLKNCLDEISDDKRDLILDYYLDTKSAKIERRRIQAAALGIEPGALRIRAHRIRAILEKCVKKCLKALKN